jgi:hypothetical protein
MNRPSAFSRGQRWAAIILLVWNLIGVAALVSQATMDLDALARTDPYQARMFLTMPSWAWAAYAIAVIASVIGSGALLLRKAIAVRMFALSLAAMLVQFGRVFLATDLIAVKGWGAAAFPAFIVIVGLFALWFAWRLRGEGKLA